MPFVLLGLGALLVLALSGRPQVSRDVAMERCPTLDPHMPTDLVEAVCVALANEGNSSELARFADALLPDYPVAAGLLQKASKGVR